MKLSQVKMVVTDMDGTLLNSKNEVSTQFFELYEGLKSHKVHFVAASGRQHNSIEDKLSSISEEITIVAENGSYIKQGDTELGTTLLSADDVKLLIPVIREAAGLYGVLCGKKSAYIEERDPKFQNILQEYYTKFDGFLKVNPKDYIVVSCLIQSERQFTFYGKCLIENV